MDELIDTTQPPIMCSDELRFRGAPFYPYMLVQISGDVPGAIPRVDLSRRPFTLKPEKPPVNACANRAERWAGRIIDMLLEIYPNSATSPPYLNDVIETIESFIQNEAALVTGNGADCATRNKSPRSIRTSLPLEDLVHLNRRISDLVVSAQESIGELFEELEEISNTLFRLTNKALARRTEQSVRQLQNQGGSNAKNKDPEKA